MTASSPRTTRASAAPTDEHRRSPAEWVHCGRGGSDTTRLWDRSAGQRCLCGFGVEWGAATAEPTRRATEAGGECSATAIRAIIKKLVAAENPAKPLSDNKMASVLAEQGIKVARRTIAKYRESLSISPSNERKRLA